MELPRVTLDEFLSFNPCWRNSEKGRRRLRYYAHKLGGSADALEILALRRIPAGDRLWAVLRAEFIPDRILHEIACRYAEDALSRIDNPDPRSIRAIAVKRRWIAGEATDAELAAASAAACAAAWAASAAAWAARAAAEDAACAAAQAAAEDAAQAAAEDAAEDAREAARAEARAAQVDMLTQILREYVGTGGGGYAMRVYEGIGPNKGKVIYGDSDARALMYEQIGIEPINGWENIDPEFMRQFDRDMLDWWYSGPWIVYPSEEAYRASYREAV